MSNYQKLEAWKESMLLVKEIYFVTKTFPAEERYGLISQFRRAAVSVPSNIAEGMGRQYKKDTIQFLHVARGSIYELETLLKVAVMVNIIDGAIFSELTSRIDKTARLLNGLISYAEASKLK
jgi:four helix bundle protein